MSMAEKKATQPAQKKGFDSLGKFFKDVKVELGKVIWPGRDEVVASTVVVLVAVAFFAIFIGLIDVLFVAVIKIFSA